LKVAFLDDFQGFFAVFTVDGEVLSVFQVTTLHACAKGLLLGTCSDFAVRVSAIFKVAWALPE
jgi:hypothetical protein